MDIVKFDFIVYSRNIDKLERVKIMIKEMSNKITSLCVERNIVAAEKRDIYDYGMGLIISTVFSLTVIIGIAIIFDKFLEALVFVMFFAFLRSASGGYHSGTYLSCFIKFSIMVGLSLFLSHMILRRMDVSYAILMAAMICIVAIMFVIKYAPVDTSNKRFSEIEKVSYREKSMKMVLIQGTLLAMIAYINPSLGLTGSFGMLMQGMTLFPVLNK